MALGAAFVGSGSGRPSRVPMQGYRLDRMLEASDGDRSLQVSEGFWVGEKGFEKSQRLGINHDTISAISHIRSHIYIYMFQFQVLPVRGYPPPNGMVSPWKAGPTHSVMLATAS